MLLFFSTTVLKASLVTEKGFSRFLPPKCDRETADWSAKSIVLGNCIDLIRLEMNHSIM